MSLVKPQSEVDMGIWNVCRLLARRWPVSVPLLMLTGAAAAVAAFNVRPDYVGTGYVSLLPPTLQRTAAAGEALKVNPWNTETLASAVVIRLNSKSVVDRIGAEGFPRAWEVALDDRYQAVVRIEVTSPTRAQAESTLARLLREVDDEVDRQQARYPNLTPEDKITVTRLDSAGVQTATGTVVRATLVVAVAGVLLATAAAAGVDAALRRRGRGRSGAHRGPVPAATSIDTDATQPVVITNVPLHMPVAGTTPASLPSPGRNIPSGLSTSTGGAASGPDDSTIVLPLSNAPWADRPRGGALGNSAADRDDTTADVG